MSRRWKYKTKAEREAGTKKKHDIWVKKHKEHLKNWRKEYYQKRRAELMELRKKNREALNSEPADMSAFEARLAVLESEMKKYKEEQTEILASLEEALKDSKKALDLVKWGEKK